MSYYYSLKLQFQPRRTFELSRLMVTGIASRSKGQKKNMALYMKSMSLDKFSFDF